MEVLSNHCEKDLVKSIQVETAKASNELQAAKIKLAKAEAEVYKANGRLRFILAITKELESRYTGD